MTEDFGQMRDLPPPRHPHPHQLPYSPPPDPPPQRGPNNGLSADFLGDYVTTFFPLDDSTPASAPRQAQIRGAVSFVANELLENAMKFHDAETPEPITIQLSLDAELITFHESNAIGRAATEEFKVFIERLRAADPGELYLQQLEHNAVSERSAGLGYLTMINDYGAELAWRFEPLDGGACRVTTQVTLKL